VPHSFVLQDKEGRSLHSKASWYSLADVGRGCEAGLFQVAPCQNSYVWFENFPKVISKLLNRSHMQIFFQDWSGKNSVISKITPAEWCSKWTLTLALNKSCNFWNTYPVRWHSNITLKPL
jgi:hypothetical protein